MWKWIAFPVILAVVLAVGGTTVWNLMLASQPSAVPVAQTQGPAPKVVVDEVTYDFDTMEQAANGQHTFTIKNEGRGVLVLYPKKPSCGCQKLVLESEDVPEGEPKRVVLEVGPDGEFPTGLVFKVKPGGVAKATVHWNTKLTTGQYRQTVPIATNDPDHPRITFQITGFVTPLVLFSTQELQGEAMTTERTELSFVVASEVLDSLEIASVKSAQGEVELRWEEIDPKTAEEFTDPTQLRCAYRVYVVLPEGLPVGPYRDVITVTLRMPDRPDALGNPGEYKQDVNLSVEVRGPVTVTSPRVDFGDVFVNEGAKKRLYVIVRGVEQPKVSLQTVTPDFVKVTVEPTSTPNRFLVVLEVPPSAPPGKFRGTVVLATNHPQASEARIAIRGTVVGAGQ